MTTNQEGVHDSVRSYTSTTSSYEADWHALFDLDAIASGPFNSRMLAWINSVLGTSYTALNSAMTAFAVDQGFTRWTDMNTFVTGARITLDDLTIAENTAQGTLVGNLDVVNGSGSYTFTLTDTAGNRFQLDGVDTSLLEAGATSTNYESATSHNITVEADNGVDAVIQRTFSIIVTDVDDTAPTITSSNTVSVAENATLSHSLTANESVTWSIIGGADQGDFEISGSTLRWLSNGTQNFESPNDADTNNTYIVDVRATDAATNTTDQTITVTVTDVSEGGGPTGDGYLLEDGSSFLLAENSDFLILE